jgi:hypothetical protein
MKLFKKMFSGGAGIGTGVGSVYVAGTTGLSGAGIMSGLATLGLGLGAATGIGVVILIAGGTALAIDKALE